MGTADTVPYPHKFSHFGIEISEKLLRIANEI